MASSHKTMGVLSAFRRVAATKVRVNTANMARTHARRYAADAGHTARTTATAPVEQGGFSKFWNSKVGPKTVHFWAPMMKWAVVIAGAADFFRPASSVSLEQSAALVATGAIWTRWCLIIKPRNVFLASVNFALFIVGATQTSRVLLYRRSLSTSSIESATENATIAAKGAIEGARNEATHISKEVGAAVDSAKAKVRS